jgi:hypothetical protein
MGNPGSREDVSSAAYASPEVGARGEDRPRMAVGALLLWMGVYLTLSAQLYGQTLLERLASIPPLQYLEFGLTYTLLLSGIIAVQLSRRLDAQRRDAAVLLALAREAELRALKAQC